MKPENVKDADKKEVVFPDCPVQAVVVYPDRAEVTRLVKVRLGVGDGEVVLKNLSKSLDKDSVRVDGIGPASITEVSFQEIAVTEEVADQATASEEVKELKQKIADLRGEISSLEDELSRLTVQEDLLTKYSDGLFSAGNNAHTSDLLDGTTIAGVFGFLETFEEKSLQLKVDKHKKDLDKSEKNAELKTFQTKLRTLEPTLWKVPEVLKQQVIGVLLTVREEGEIQLRVSYVVSNASWSPKYDLRVSSADRTMDVNYFGMVEQNTGEDWVDAKLSLSTATPSIGGSAPSLDTCRLTLIPNAYPAKGRGSIRKKKARSAFGFGGEMTQAIAAPLAQVSEGLSSSVFEISSPANIPADKSGHKVHVATIGLKPTFEYDTVPKLAQHAFLRAKVINDSSYPFLSGPANVFLDQSYVTETHLSSTSPKEEFSCSLGVDPSVKVVYKPVKRYREQSGFVSKNVTYTYKQVTEIFNSRAEPTVITFKDQIPKSEDEKLKVTLVEPAIGKQKQGAPPPNPKLNAGNNVEWRVELSAEESKSLTIHYTVEFPAQKEVEGL